VYKRLRPTNKMMSHNQNVTHLLKNNKKGKRKNKK
jgi:hypothetical protein